MYVTSSLWTQAYLHRTSLAPEKNLRGSWHNALKYVHGTNISSHIPLCWLLKQYWLCRMAVYLVATVNTLGKINPLNAQLNPICRLLTLLGAHHILHVSRIRVKYYKFWKDFLTYINFIDVECARACVCVRVCVWLWLSSALTLRPHNMG
jgi:hypothetical protein